MKDNQKSKVFLGGTCNGSVWREVVIEMLEIDYFNPVVEDWTPDCVAIEDEEKISKCDIHLYVITSAMSGVYSIAEAVKSAYTPGVTCIFQVLPDGFDDGQLRSLKATAELIRGANGIAFINADISVAVGLCNVDHITITPLSAPE